MENKDKEWMEKLKIKGMVDYAGHYVIIKTVDKNKKVWWEWNDGAVTNEGFKRDRLFNTLYKMLNFYKNYKTFIKIGFILFCIFYVYMLIK